MAEEQAKKYETVGAKVQKLRDIINRDYVGKLDKNGIPLLPEEGKLRKRRLNPAFGRD